MNVNQVIHVNIHDISGKEVAPGVTERVLLRSDQTTPGGLSARHYILTQGELVFDEPNVEYQHYIIGGCALFGRRLVHGETAIFVPCARTHMGRHRFVHQGEGELRMLTVTYKLPRKNFRWAKTRIKNLYEVPQSAANYVGYSQLFTEEEHAVMGALRMQALDVQTDPPLWSRGPPHDMDPETVMYFLRGTGECSPNKYKVGPGSLVYAPEMVDHTIWNTSKRYPLQYLVLEFVEQDRMWTERGHKNQGSRRHRNYPRSQGSRA